MTEIESEIIAFLSEITSNGAFVASGTEAFIVPGMEVKGFGELALPVTPLQAQNLIKAAHKAPFGKGMDTVLDTNVRSVWEIDAADIAFKNPAWAAFIAEIIVKVKATMGIGHQKVSASLYKLLIYEKDDFFVWHKDSEKEKNMFATMVVTLPSAHEGGELAVRFKDEEIVVDSAQAAANYMMTYTAFYADCDHEVRPLLSGYRVCLVYNLLQSAQYPPLSANGFDQTADELASLLTEWTDEISDKPKVILLGHQYTPTNFALDSLKANDVPVVETLLAAAESAGYFARLGLLTHYKCGELEDTYEDYSSRGRRSRYNDDDDEDLTDGTMGEIYEEYTRVEHWESADVPNLGNFEVRTADILSEEDLGADEPIEKEAEGYTGNAGMTLEYWYHYGAIVLWSKQAHKAVLNKLSLPNRLDWLAYYAKNINILPEAKDFLAHLSANLGDISILNSYENKGCDASGLAEAWVILNNEAAFLKNGSNLVPLFERIKPESWRNLIAAYPASAFEPIFKMVFAKHEVEPTAYALNLIADLDNKSDFEPFYYQMLGNMPTYLKNLSQYITPKANNYYKELHYAKAIEVVRALLKISANETNEVWNSQIAELLTQINERIYVNTVLVAVLLEPTTAKNSSLYSELKDFCCKELQARTAERPEPLPNWTRKLPENAKKDKLWTLLAPFLSSPTEKIFDYRENESVRNTMEYLIKSVPMDLEMETIKTGRPYCLRIKKNNAAYLAAFKDWEIDTILLADLR